MKGKQEGEEVTHAVAVVVVIIIIIVGRSFPSAATFERHSQAAHHLEPY